MASTVKEEVTDVEQKECVPVVKQEDEETDSSLTQEPTIPTPCFPLTYDQAALTRYPLGCPVVHVDSAEVPPVVTMGVVQSVSFDVASKELLYNTVHSTQPNTVNREVKASEGRLQFAPLCPVEATLDVVSGPSKKSAIVLTSYQPLSTSEPLYLLQEDTPSGSLLHGIHSSSIKYRLLPTVSGPAEDVHSEAPVHESARSGQDSARPITDPTSNKPFLASAKKSCSASRVGKRPPNPEQGVKTSVMDNDRHSARMEPEIIENEQPSPKRAKQVDDVGSSQRNSAVDGRKEGATPNTETLAHANKLSVFRTSYSTKEGEAKENKDAVFETRHCLPVNVFDIALTKHFFEQHSERLSEKTQCQIDLEVRAKRMAVVLKGKRGLEENAVCVLEESLLTVLESSSHGRALYHLTVLNDFKHMCVCGGREIAYRNCYHVKGQKMCYIYSKNLPDDHSELLDIVVGEERQNLELLTRDTECHIEINEQKKSQIVHPHYVIYGGDAAAVTTCANKVGEKLKDARKRIESERSNFENSDTLL